jgi:hypothetical protein
MLQKTSGKAMLQNKELNCRQIMFAVFCLIKKFGYFTNHSEIFNNQARQESYLSNLKRKGSLIISIMGDD